LALGNIVVKLKVPENADELSEEMEANHIHKKGFA
jgi:hypothetical protein